MEGKDIWTSKAQSTTVSQDLITMTLQQGSSLKPRIQANQAPPPLPPPMSVQYTPCRHQTWWMSSFPWLLHQGQEQEMGREEKREREESKEATKNSASPMKYGSDRGWRHNSTGDGARLS